MPAHVIHDSTGNDVLFPKKFGRGYDPGQRTQFQGLLPQVEVDARRRVILVHPAPLGKRPFMGAAPKEFKIIPRSEWDARYDEMVKRRTGLRHIRQTMNKGKPHKSYDQNGQGYCFPAGTLVRMADGSQKNIEDVKILDEVLSAEGNVRRVLQCHVRDYEGDLITLKVFGHGHLKGTPEHPVLTKRGYVPLGEVVHGDFVCMPKYAPARSSVVVTADHVEGLLRRVKNVAGSAAWEARIPDEGDGSCKRVPDLLELTPGVGRILGLWLAEGHVDGGCLVWSFNSKKESDTLVPELMALIEKEWGVTARTKLAKDPSVRLVFLQGRMWVQLFKSLCGQYAGGKRPHADLMSGPKEFLRGLFWGWMAGDGCRSKTKKSRWIGATVSHKLALAMYDIANALGMNPVISWEPGKPDDFAKTRQPVWKVRVDKDPSDYRNNWRMESEPDRVWRKVRFIEKSQFRGTVFNIGVEVDNSYVAEGIAVHNCWAYSSCGAITYKRGAANQPYKRLSAHAVACKIKNFRDEGGWCGLSMKWAIEKGYPTTAKWPEKSMSRANDTAEAWEEAKLFRPTEYCFDVSRSVYDQEMVEELIATFLFLNMPLALDFDWWSHSVTGFEWTRIERGSWGPSIHNSWTDAWGDEGVSTLQGSRGQADGAVGVCEMLATAA